MKAALHGNPATRALWWRFLAISLVFAMLLSVLYVWLVRETTGSARLAVQRSVTLLVANALEGAPYPESMRRLDAMLAESPEMPAHIWVVDAGGLILASRTADPLPQGWGEWEKPQRAHEVTTMLSAWRRGGLVTVTRLKDAQPVYLVTRNSRPGGRPVLRYQALFFIATLVAAIFLGLSLVTLYLRMRSREARQVLARLTTGDLAARFAPGRLDAVGELMHEFNRMAEEIERLVSRLRQAEDARRHLLQELGHDLRTPLTSLRTSVDTLCAHADTMPREDREAFLAIVRGELDYFVRLVDDLFFIADLAEPRYRRLAQRVDLRELVASEVASMEGRLPRPDLRVGLRAVGECIVEGDRMLLARLVRNGLDNAARHATRQVQATLAATAGSVQLLIEDDGPGMSDDQLENFGRRRSQRLPADAGCAAMSLGLGSVIMKTVVDLHGGRLTASRCKPQGTRIAIELPPA